MRCINCDEPASKCACDPAVLRDAWEDRAVNAEARAEAAEARVKELEAENHRCWQARDESDRRITQLDADLAAAKTVQVHALVADVVMLALRGDAHDTGLWMAVAKLRLEGITIQPVRTYTREEAEAVYAAVYGAPTRTKEKEILVNALMGVPVPPDPRDAVDAPGNFRPVVLFDGAHAAVADAAARGAAELEAQMVERTTPGADEAGGEGAASAYDEVMERVNAHQVANAPQEDAGFLIDDAALGAEGDSLVTLIRAVRLINAKVDTLARRA